VKTVAASALVLIGAAFMFAAALGVVRFPDLYTRLQAVTKAATHGVAGVLCSVAVAVYATPVTIRALMVAAFFLLTSPVAAHAIARSAHSRGVPLAPEVKRALERRGRRTGTDGRTGRAVREPPRAPAAGPEGDRMQDYRP
jgi:multicomponent Na+:H+ antiporter subunit G